MQSDFNHVPKAAFAVFGRQGVMRDQVVADRQNRQRAPFVACGKDVKLGRFHFHGEDAVAHHLVIQVGPFVVEDIR